MLRNAAAVMFLVLISAVMSAKAAPNLLAQVTPKGLLISSTGGDTGVCTVDLDISHVVDGERVSQHVSLDGLVIPQRAQPIVLWRLPTLIDLRIESAVSISCN